jgi:hypothetical protein
LRSASIVWYASAGPLFSLFLAFVFAEKDDRSCRGLFCFLQRTIHNLSWFYGKIMSYRYIQEPLIWSIRTEVEWLLYIYSWSLWTNFTTDMLLCRS